MDTKDLKIGTQSVLGKITRIYSTSSKVVLFETNKQGNISYEADADVDLSCLNSIRALDIEIQSILTTTSERRKFAPHRAIAHRDCFNGNTESGVKVLENLLITVKNYRKLKSRLCYMLSAILFVVINITLCALANTVWLESLNKYIVLLYTISTFGSLGGLISILSKIPKLELDINGSNFLQVVDGFSRIFLSMVSSVIIFVLIKSDIVLGALNDIPNNDIFYAFAIISGFSEKFIPDIIKSIEKKKLEE